MWYNCKIQEKLKEPLKLLVESKLYNSLDVKQGQYLIKLSCKSYPKKELHSHAWIDPAGKIIQITIKYDKEFFNVLHQIKGPESEDERVKLATKNERVLIGEINFSVIICGPDIMYAVIKISQFS